MKYYLVAFDISDDKICYYFLCAACRKQSTDAKGVAVMEVPLAIIV